MLAQSSCRMWLNLALCARTRARQHVGVPKVYSEQGWLWLKPSKTPMIFLDGQRVMFPILKSSILDRCRTDSWITSLPLGWPHDMESSNADHRFEDRQNWDLVDFFFHPSSGVWVCPWLCRWLVRQSELGMVVGYHHGDGLALSMGFSHRGYPRKLPLRCLKNQNAGSS